MEKTLTELLKNKVVIPMIQRDYAQGRVNYKEKRSAFLKNIEQHLSDGSELSLQFVYGNMNGDEFYPLDGQQRITTLWLIKWYLSYKTGKLKESSELLKRFSYKTRSSTSRFMECLLTPQKMKSIDDKDQSIAESICMQTWFVQEWKNDPSVDAMLRMLSGEKYERGEDSIEGVFEGKDLAKCYSNFDKLVFEYYEIGTDKLPISDDLYIKLNARGKVLTHFENLKPDLFSKVSSAKTAANKIDGIWTDLFWDHEKKVLEKQFHHSVDDEMFMFVNRFAMSELIEKLLNDSISKDKIPDDTRYKELYGENGNDQRIKYVLFDRYAELLTDDSFKKIETILDLLSGPNGKSIKGIIDDKTDGIGENHSIFSRYKLDKDKPECFAEPIELLPTTYEERIYFYSIFRYFFIASQKKSWIYDETDFKRWIRITRNLVNNAYITNVSEMLGCFETFKEILDKYEKSEWGEIFKCLSKISCSGDSELDRQLQEEVIKAKRILKDPSIEKEIVNAEKIGFFNGTIRFLYSDGSGIEEKDWENFPDKKKKAEEYFGDLNSEDKWKKLIIDFLKCFKGFSDFKDHDDYYVFTTLGDAARGKSWKRGILCNPDLSSRVDALLQGKTEEITQEPNYNDFLASSLCSQMIHLLYLQNKKGFYCIRIKEEGGKLYPRIVRYSHPDEILYLDSERWEGYKLIKDKNVKFKNDTAYFDSNNFLKCEMRIGDKKPYKYEKVLYLLRDLKFEYNGLSVTWKEDGKIYDVNKIERNESLEAFFDSFKPGV